MLHGVVAKRAAAFFVEPNHEAPVCPLTTLHPGQVRREGLMCFRSAGSTPSTTNDVASPAVRCRALMRFTLASSSATWSIFYPCKRVVGGDL
jgi:hypothetical protein